MFEGLRKFEERSNQYKEIRRGDIKMKALTMKKYSVVLMTAVMAASMLAGCGKADAAGSAKEAGQNTAVEATVETSAVTEVEATQEIQEEESNITPPYMVALEKYNEIISGLSENQYYAFADACEDYDVLLVTDGVYDNLDGNMATIDATVYGLDADGNVIEMGKVMSSGTAYPLAVYDGCLIYGGNHHVAMSFIKDGSIITKLDASEEFDTDGNATYYLFDLENQYEGEVDDDSTLMKMYEYYGEATVLNFVKAE